MRVEQKPTNKTHPEKSIKGSVLHVLSDDHNWFTCAEKLINELKVHHMHVQIIFRYIRTDQSWSSRTKTVK